MICVVQPPPSAKWGKMTVPDAGAAARSATGRVVTRKSPRSFVNPRSATAAIGSDEVKVNVPVIDEPPLNGGSLRNFAIWPFAGIVVDPLSKLPLRSVKKNETVAG